MGRHAWPSAVRCLRLVGRRAFTLIELLLVLAILGILLGIAIPAFEGMAAGTGGKDTAVQLLALTRYAQSAAVADGVNYRLIIDLSGRSYYLARLDGTQYVPLGEEVGRPHVLPDGVDLAYSDGVPPDQAAAAAATGQIRAESPVGDVPTAAAPFVEFYPSGRIDPAAIRVTSVKDNSVRDVVCQSPTEPFRIIESDGQAKN